MTPANTYTATCEREGTSWVVYIPELGKTMRTARLSQVEGAARELVARFGGADATPARVVINLAVHHDLMELLDDAAAARAVRDRVSVEAVTLRRGLAQRLTAEGFVVRDVAALLGLSIGRAQQLIEGSPLAPRATRHPNPTGNRSSGVASTRAPTTNRVEAAKTVETIDAQRAAVNPHCAYQHEAVFYRGDEDFLATAVPFVLDGVALGQPVMVAVSAPRLTKLQAAVGPDASAVQFVDMAELGANPARIIPAWRKFVDDHGGPGRPVRGIGEPIWASRRPAEIVESQLHEALLNVAVEPDTPLWLLCPYDVDALPSAVIEEASRSHPTVREGGHFRGSTSYGGKDHVDALAGSDLAPPPAQTPAVTFTRDDIADVRRRVGAHASSAGLASHRATDLALAVTEVATNSVRYGGGGGTLRMWRLADALVVEIADAGHITDPLVGRRTPALTTERDRGLWLANQLCDLVQLRSGPSGTTARVLTWL